MQKLSDDMKVPAGRRNCAASGINPYYRELDVTGLAGQVFLKRTLEWRSSANSSRASAAAIPSVNFGLVPMPDTRQRNRHLAYFFEVFLKIVCYGPLALPVPLRLSPGSVREPIFH